MMRKTMALVALVMLLQLIGATTEPPNVSEQLLTVVEWLRSIVPVIALGLFILAGVVYAVGQIFDVQTRQKAQSWAMSMVVGGIIGVLIVLIAPWLVDFLLGFSTS